MKQAAEVIGLIARTSGTSDKLYLLKKNENVPHLKDILKFIYNPLCKTGIADTKLNKMLKDVRAYEGNLERYDVDFIMRHLKYNSTGRDEDCGRCAMFIENMRRKYPDNEDVVMVAKGVVTQNLKIGASVKTLNTAYGNDFIPVISCMLGTLYGDVKPASIKWPCVVTEKLDGIRRVLIKQDGICMMYSRSGHYDPYCVEILEEAKHLPDNHVYDGELLAIGDFKNSIELRQATNSIANSKGNKTGLTFNIFDMVPVDEFFKGMSREHALNRKIRLGATLMDESIQLLHEDWARLIAGFGIHQDIKVIKSVPILAFAKNFTEIEPVVEEIWGRGGEGVMLNTATGLYELKRSKQLLKVKHTEEFKLKVIGVTEGFGKFEDTLGALVVDYKGNKVGVGSGFTDAQRKQIWDNPDDYLDRYIEVESFGESKDMLGNVSINCPIFKRFVGDNE